MEVQRVYIDTSVLGGCFDPEVARWSNALIEDFRVGRLKPVISEIIIGRHDKIRFFTAVNLERGYKPLSIYSSREVASDEEDNH